MANATTSQTTAPPDYLGFRTAKELKDFVINKNKKLIGKHVVALVRDRYAGRTTQFHFIVRSAKTEVLYLILPDCKELCIARVRQERKDVPFLLEVLA